MSAGMPELGSKISLISRADIRYEGRLFTVDPEECTIALASVRSFGTEDRETKFPVPAQTQVYDYILFRGSDIKEIRVIDNVPTLPNDPAIMQLSVPPSLGQQQFQTQGYLHPVLGPMGPPMGQFGAGYGGPGPAGLAPGMGLNQGPRNMPSKQPSELIMSGSVPLPDLSSAVEPLRPNEHDLIGGASRSTTPASLGSRKSPTADQAVQVSGAGKKDDKRISRPIQPPPGRVQQRDRRDSRGEQYSAPDLSRNQNRPPPNRNNQQGQGYHQGPRQNNWGTQYTRGQPRNKNIRARGASAGSSMASSSNTYRQNQPPQTSNNKPKNTLKFDNDYDFEQANTQFEELRSQLEKVKIKDNKPEVNGDNEKKDDSGNETGAGEGEQEEEDPIYYDKTKSFFDNISCEAVERSKGRSQRTDWRAERKLNSETFGVSSTRRSGYRGRGGYYNRGGGYRPGYRGGYNRPQGNQGNRRVYQDGRPAPTQNQQSIQGSNTNSNGQPAPSSVPASGN
ncbi:hypothetical protein RN001_009133 [Aquatica leii]|uniref:Protein LSM14 homolog B n=1 Tax=Aquatica leii TaxID=1421715 RepID=A0AAN7P4S9_9COLE|nr:hypothetical protein RN001_009133 [Aquatica leii]